ncbi:MAG: bifunctional UDP-N-acetylglucosamine diphosphorylase/glucosamine-1-phosphate N-acetyltransferase GlmU [Myxococcota bacterium]|nr:bifunctional UDP-N-acetylglucosamine diphosphorylase/glucosamine-1-phosphate N-acetyltransferase GlmU [Myxococcota bacterium]
MTMRNSPSNLAVIVLAAGSGTRMKSRRPKVLHEMCGRSMLAHVLATAEALEPERLIVVVGEGADEVEEAFVGRCEFVLQAEQKGTGHAVLQAEPKLSDFEGDVLVLYADVPLLRPETLHAMQADKEHGQADLLILTAEAETIPGRILRDAVGRVTRVVEKQDATRAEMAILERNTGVYLLGAQLLRSCLAKLDDSNAQGELYLTDVVGLAVGSGKRVSAMQLEDANECLGINTREELANAVAVLRSRINSHWMDEGVTLVDPASTYIDTDVRIGRDSVIDPGCQILGDTVVGEGCHIKAYTVIESSRIGDDVSVGPSSHLRADTRLDRGVKIGNFVEVKNAVLGEGTKAAHLTYIGDADVGERVNFGCGSVIVNYDGFAKHRTSVGDDVFIGCNVNLIAPVTVRNHSYLAAGSTINLEVPEEALAVARAKQRNIEGWVARREARAAKAKEEQT